MSSLPSLVEDPEPTYAVYQNDKNGKLSLSSNFDAWLRGRSYAWVAYGSQTKYRLALTKFSTMLSKFNIPKPLRDLEHERLTSAHTITYDASWDLDSPLQASLDIYEEHVSTLLKELSNYREALSKAPSLSTGEQSPEQYTLTTIIGIGVDHAEHLMNHLKRESETYEERATAASRSWNQDITILGCLDQHERLSAYVQCKHFDSGFSKAQLSFWKIQTTIIEAMQEEQSEDYLKLSEYTEASDLVSGICQEAEEEAQRLERLLADTTSELDWDHKSQTYDQLLAKAHQTLGLPPPSSLADDLGDLTLESSASTQDSKKSTGRSSKAKKQSAARRRADLRARTKQTGKTSDRMTLKLRELDFEQDGEDTASSTTAEWETKAYSDRTSKKDTLSTTISTQKRTGFRIGWLAEKKRAHYREKRREELAAEISALMSGSTRGPSFTRVTNTGRFGIGPSPNQHIEVGKELAAFEPTEAEWNAIEISKQLRDDGWDKVTVDEAIEEARRLGLLDEEFDNNIE